MCLFDQKWHRGPHHQRGVTACSLPTPLDWRVFPAVAAVRRFGDAVPSRALSSSCSAAVSCSEGSCAGLKSAERPGFNRLLFFHHDADLVHPRVRPPGLRRALIVSVIVVVVLVVRHRTPAGRSVREREAVSSGPRSALGALVGARAARGESRAARILLELPLKVAILTTTAVQEGRRLLCQLPAQGNLRTLVKLLIGALAGTRQRGDGAVPGPRAAQCWSAGHRALGGGIA